MPVLPFSVCSGRSVLCTRVSHLPSVLRPSWFTRRATCPQVPRRPKRQRRASAALHAVAPTRAMVLSSVADGAVRKNNGYPVTSLSSLILASAARLSPSLSLDQCLETVVSDWPSSTHLSGIAPPSPGPVGGQLSCPHRRLSVPVVFGAVASLPKVATSLRLIAPLSPPLPAVAVVRHSPSSIGLTATLLPFLQWQTTLHTLRKGYVVFQCFILSLVCSIFLFIKPRIVLFS